MIFQSLKTGEAKNLFRFEFFFKLVHSIYLLLPKCKHQILFIIYRYV